MKQFCLIQIFAAFVSLFISIETAQAIPADRRPKKIRQPDGTTLTIRLHGDERYHYTTTEDGYTIVRNKKQIYMYAEKDSSGRLIPGKIAARDSLSRTADERAYLSSLPKGIRPVSSAVQKQCRSARNPKSKSPAPTP